MEDVGFYLEEARRSGGPVVELGVGTGRIAVPLGADGIHVIGIDSSRRMLDVCARRAALAGVTLDLRVGDLREPPVTERVPLVICPFRSLLHMHTDEDRLGVLGASYDLLVPGGRRPCACAAGSGTGRSRAAPARRRADAGGRRRAGRPRPRQARRAVRRCPASRATSRSRSHGSRRPRAALRSVLCPLRARRSARPSGAPPRGRRRRPPRRWRSRGRTAPLSRRNCSKARFAV